MLVKIFFPSEPSYLLNKPLLPYSLHQPVYGAERSQSSKIRYRTQRGNVCLNYTVSCLACTMHNKMEKHRVFLSIS